MRAEGQCCTLQVFDSIVGKREEDDEVLFKVRHESTFKVKALREVGQGLRVSAFLTWAPLKMISFLAGRCVFYGLWTPTLALR